MKNKIIIETILLILGGFMFGFFLPIITPVINYYVDTILCIIGLLMGIKSINGLKV